MTPSYYTLVTREQMDRYEWDTVDVHRLALLHRYSGPVMNAVKYLHRHKAGQDRVYELAKALQCVLDELRWQLQQSGLTNVPIEVQETVRAAQQAIEDKRGII